MKTRTFFHRLISSCFLAFAGVLTSAPALAVIPCGGLIRNINLVATSPTTARVTFDAGFPEYGLYGTSDYFLQVDADIYEAWSPYRMATPTQQRWIYSQPACYSRLGCLVPISYGRVCATQGGCSGSGWSFEFKNLAPNSRYNLTLLKSCGIPMGIDAYVAYANMPILSFTTPPVPPPPSCSLPQPTVQNPVVGATSSSVCWNAVPGAASYSVGLKAFDAASWQFGRVPSSQRCISASLPQNTAYLLSVKSVCANGIEGKWGNVTYFATFPSVPTGLRLTARVRSTNGLSYVKAQWNAVPNAKYRFIIRERLPNGSFGPWSQAVTSANYISSESIKQNVVYQIAVSAVSLIRADAMYSSYSAVVQFTG